MKKLLLLTAFVSCLSAFSFASNTSYKVDETAIDNMFAQSDDITMAAATEDLNVLSSTTIGTSALAPGDKTKGGFLIRAFFCGGFALHRSYMGTGGKTLFWYYFCIPVAGGVVACVDFWYVLLKGDEALAKYKDNPEWIVWNK